MKAPLDFCINTALAAQAALSILTVQGYAFESARAQSTVVLAALTDALDQCSVLNVVEDSLDDVTSLLESAKSKDDIAKLVPRMDAVVAALREVVGIDEDGGQVAEPDPQTDDEEDNDDAGAGDDDADTEEAEDDDGPWPASDPGEPEGAGEDDAEPE